ncbi:uncharacterized protein RCH25_009523 [Pelodytes ibericus]
MVKKNSIPDRWRTLTSVGQRIPGSRFIAFKVPLKGSTNQRVTQNQKFTPKDLLSTVRTQNEELGLIIDLTNTERYYTIKDLPKSVQYVKLHTAGLKIPDDCTIHQFKRIVRRFIWNNTDNEKLIGVHCTTGINRTGYLICRYLIDVDGWDPQTTLQIFSQSRGHPIEGEVYIDDLVLGPTRSNLGIDQPLTDDELNAFKKEEEPATQEDSRLCTLSQHARRLCTLSQHALPFIDRRDPYLVQRRRELQALIDERRRRERGRRGGRRTPDRKLENDLRDSLDFGDFDARDKTQELRSFPLMMRDRAEFLEDNRDFLAAMARHRERSYPMQDAVSDLPAPFSQRERLFHDKMLEEELMNSEKYQRMNRSLPGGFQGDGRFEDRLEMKGQHPMNFESDMLMENCDRYDVGSREMPRPAHAMQSGMSRENMDYCDMRRMGRPGSIRGFSEESWLEDGPGGPMSHSRPTPFLRSGTDQMDPGDFEEMEARRRFDKSRGLASHPLSNDMRFMNKNKAAVDMELNNLKERSGIHPRDTEFMPGSMRARPMDGPAGEQMDPMDERMRIMDQRMHPMEKRMHPMGNRMRPMDNIMHPMENRMGPMADRMGPMDERMSSMEDRMGPMSERMGPMSERMGPMSERMGPMCERMGPMSERMGPMSERMGPMSERMGPMSERMGPMSERMGPMSERMGPMSERMGPMSERMGPMSERMGPMSERMGPMSERMGPMSERMGPMSDRMGPMSDRMGPMIDRMGPMSERMGPMSERMGPTSERMGPTSDRMGPTSERMGPTSERMGPMSDRMGPMSERMGPMSERMGPMSERMGPMSERMGPMSERMGPMNERMGPMKERMGPMSERVGPMSDRMGPMSDRMGPMSDRMGPMSDRMGPMSDRMGPMSDRMGPMSDRMGPMSDRMGPMSERMGPINKKMGPTMDGMQPKDVRLLMNKPNYMQGPTRNDLVNECNPRFVDGRKSHPSEELIRGANRFAPYPAHMKSIQSNEVLQDHDGRHPAQENIQTPFGNYGMANINKQGFMPQSFPQRSMYN